MKVSTRNYRLLCCCMLLCSVILLENVRTTTGKPLCSKRWYEDCSPRTTRKPFGVDTGRLKVIFLYHFHAFTYTTPIEPGL